MVNTIFLKKDRVIQNDDCISADNTFVYPYNVNSTAMYKLESSIQLKNGLDSSATIIVFMALYSLGTIGSTPSLTLVQLEKLSITPSSSNFIFEVLTQA